MCIRCKPTFDGYVFWTGSMESFYYEANPTPGHVRNLNAVYTGRQPLNLNIPYV